MRRTPTKETLRCCTCEREFRRVVLNGPKPSRCPKCQRTYRVEQMATSQRNRAQAIAAGEYEVIHGYGGYTAGCRCEVCRKAKNDYIRDRRATARRRAAANTDRISGGTSPARWVGKRRNFEDVRHGTVFGYEERGCRCRECTSARSLKRVREQQRASSRRLLVGSPSGRPGNDG